MTPISLYDESLHLFKAQCILCGFRIPIMESIHDDFLDRLADPQDYPCVCPNCAHQEPRAIWHAKVKSKIKSIKQTFQVP